VKSKGKADVGRKKGPNKRAGERGPNTGRTSGRVFDAARREQFLEHLALHGLRAKAAREVGVCLQTVMRHLTDDPLFAEGYQHAFAQYREILEEEIHRRGVVGVQEPIFWQGAIVGWVTRYSDRLLMEHARRHIPEYREAIKVEQTTQHGGSIAVGLADLAKLSTESRAELRRILEREGGRHAATEVDRAEAPEEH
jgi:hypothetical protein